MYGRDFQESCKGSKYCIVTSEFESQHYFNDANIYSDGDVSKGQLLVLNAIVQRSIGLIKSDDRKAICAICF